MFVPPLATNYYVPIEIGSGAIKKFQRKLICLACVVTRRPLPKRILGAKKLF